MSNEPSMEQVLKRNSIERLKKEKAPLKIVDELPALIEAGYEAISEEDVVRLQWYGLYHDKPKIGQFMMRIKVPGGILTPNKLRTIGQIAQRDGRNYGELSTRQNIQLHWIELRHLPDIFATLKGAGLTTVGGCGDNVRNITGCPVAGIDRDELFDTLLLVDEAAKFFYGNPDYADLPRKHKITIAACAHQCNGPDINCIALIGAQKEGRQGFGVRVGGGLSTVPRIARDLGVFIGVDEMLPVLRAIIDVWKETTKYRMSRVKARLKFMIDDVGPEQFRKLVEDKLGRQLEDFPAPPPLGETEHMGIHPQKQDGLYYIGVPVSLGLMDGDKMIRVAELAERFGGDIRLTRHQNFILTGVPEAQIDAARKELAQIGFPLDVNGLRAASIACTGSPLCNFSVASTKPKLGELIEHLEATFGKEVDGLRINLDGCPHACAHHWIGDIGLQGTTLRERGAGGEKQEGYDIYLRGGLGPNPTIGFPVIRRVPSDHVHLYVERLVRGYLQERHSGERFKAYCQRQTDEQLIATATGSQ